MTLGDAKLRVWDRLDEDPNDPLRYPEYLIQLFLREAIEQWSIVVGGERRTQTISLVADQLEYNLTRTDTAVAPLDNLPHHTRVISVIENTTNIPLIPISYLELYDREGRGRQDWRTQNSTRCTHYILFSFDRIWFWPTMGSVTSETITVTYDNVKDYEMNGDDTEELVLPTDWQHQAVDYVVGRCMLLGAKGDRIERGMKMVQRWMDSLDDQNIRRRSPGTPAVTFAPILGR